MVSFFGGGVKEVRLDPTVSQWARESTCKTLPRTDDHLWEERASVIGSSWPN